MSAEKENFFFYFCSEYFMFYKLKILMKTIIQTLFFQKQFNGFSNIKKLFDRFTERVLPLDIYHVCIIFVLFTQRKPWPSERNACFGARGLMGLIPE